jgi:proteasome inhibitor subunit 1 (PI31)
LTSFSLLLTISGVEFDEKNAQLLWTAEDPSHNEFCYAHSQSSLKFVVKVSRLGVKTVIMGIAMGDDKTASFDIQTEDFTSKSFFPWAEGVNGNIVGAYIRENRMDDLASLFKINILQKLIPGINKLYIEGQDTAETQA